MPSFSLLSFIDNYCVTLMLSQKHFYKDLSSSEKFMEKTDTLKYKVSGTLN